MLSNKKSADILDSEDFIELTSKANMYNSIFICEAFIILLSLLKLISVFGNNSSFKIIIKSMSQSVKGIIAYMLVIIPLFCGFAIIGMGVWGANLKEFHTFGNAFISVLFLTMG